MNENGQKIVDFSKCLDCIHFELDESESPCDECLNEPVNTYSTTPVHFKKDED